MAMEIVFQREIKEEHWKEKKQKKDEQQWRNLGWKIFIPLQTFGEHWCFRRKKNIAL